MLVPTTVDPEPEYFSSVASGVVPHPEALARAVRQRRAELRLSQEEIRGATGLSVTTVGKIEKGDADLAVQRSTLRRLDVALEWTPSTCESWLAGRGGVVTATSATDVAALVEELAPLVAAQLRGGPPSTVSVAGLPTEIVEAFERLLTAIRNALVHGL